MAESIKLNGNKYIDAEGVYDHAMEKTLSEINTIETYQGITNCTLQKVGRLVICYLGGVHAYASAVVVAQGGIPSQYRPISATAVWSLCQARASGAYNQAVLHPNANGGIDGWMQTASAESNIPQGALVYGTLVWFTA